MNLPTAGGVHDARRVRRFKNLVETDLDKDPAIDARANEPCLDQPPFRSGLQGTVAKLDQTKAP